MKKRLLSIVLALTMSICLLPVTTIATNNPPNLTRDVEGLTLNYGSQEAKDRVHVNETEKSLTSGVYITPQYYPLSITGNGVSPYFINLNQVDLTLNNVSLHPESLRDYPIYLSGRSLTLKGKNNVSVSKDIEINNEVFFKGITISGDGSLLVKDITFGFANTRLTEGSLTAISGDSGENSRRTRCVITDYEGLIIDGGSLTVKQDDYFDPTNDKLMNSPAAPIWLGAPTVINGGKIFVESGTDLRTGKPIPCVDIEGEGSLTINGGIFNVGDLNANTVLGYPVASDCQVVKNQDPDTKELYPFKVQKSTEQLVIYPKNAVANHEKDLQLRAVGTAAENITWSLSGNNHPNTVINSDGTLNVSYHETAKHLTVTAQGEGGVSVSTTVSVEPEIFDIWFIIQEWYGYGYTVYEHKQLKRGEVYVLPQIDNIPGFKHLAWYDRSDPYNRNEYPIGNPFVADHNEVYWTKLEESEENFIIGGVEYDMPEVGGCINSAGGTTKTGDWWMELPNQSCPELTLNGVELTKGNIPAFNGQSDQIMVPAKKKLTIHVRGDNKILPPKLSTETSSKLCAIHHVLDSYDSQVIIDFEEGSTLTVQGRPGQESILLSFGETPLTLRGNGRLSLIPENIKDDLIYNYYVKVTIGDHAVMEYDATHIHATSLNDGCNIQETVLSEQGTLLFKSDDIKPHLDDLGITLPTDGSMNITAGSSSGGNNSRTLTFEEFLEQMPCLRYFKISPDPVPVHVPSYPLWLGGVQVTDENKDDILEDGKASYDPASATLTLNNVQVTAPGGKNLSEFSGLTYTGNKLTIANTGNSAFTGAASGHYSIGFLHDSPKAEFDLQIKGDGMLRFAGDSGAETSYGGMGNIHSVNIDGSVKMELLGKTQFYLRSSLWDALNDSTSGTVLCSDSLSGSNPVPHGKNEPYGMPYAIFYHPVVTNLSIQYRTFDGDWKDIVHLVPLVSLSGDVTIPLRPKIYDQMGLIMVEDADVLKAQCTLAISGEMSSENLEQNLDGWGAKKLGLNPIDYEIAIDCSIEPCYIGLELTHNSTGKKFAVPAFLVSDSICQGLEIHVKPEYENKVYREGDDFDPNTITVTRVYPDVPSDRHPDAFLCDKFYVSNANNLNAGTALVGIIYFEEIPFGDKWQIITNIPVTVLGNYMIAQDPGGIRVTSPTASTLMIASYNSKGQMTNVTTHSITADTENRLFAMSIGQKAFLLDENHAPLCAGVGK